VRGLDHGEGTTDCNIYILGRGRLAGVSDELAGDG